MTAPPQDSAQAVLDVLLGRRGFVHWWDDIDEETQSEILAAIRAAMQPQTTNADAP